MIPFTFLAGALLVLFVLAIFLTELERFGWVTVTLIASCVATQWLHVADILGYVTTHAGETALYVLGYLVAGVLWSFVKWFSFLVQFRDKYRELKADHVKRHGIFEPLTASQVENFHSRLHSSFHGNSLTSKPQAANNKHRIIAWMGFWPFSVVGTLLNDPVKRLFKLIFTQLQATYQSMADRMFRNDQELK